MLPKSCISHNWAARFRNERNSVGFFSGKQLGVVKSLQRSGDVYQLRLVEQHKGDMTLGCKTGGGKRGHIVISARAIPG